MMTTYIKVAASAAQWTVPVAIDDFGFANRIRTRSEAMRTLIRRGLNASGADTEKPE